MTERVRTRARVEGTVQGVGFRPYVYDLATRLSLAGVVGNDSDGAFLEVEGDPATVSDFFERLESEAPRLAVIEAVRTESLAPAGETGFAIVDSVVGAERRALVTADTGTCDDCLAEVLDPADRRYRYPFTNCTNCGPRFTIVRDVPYDRPNTTMAGFTLCEDCAREYHDPTDRRFHAQPVCCPVCGPALSMVDAAGAPLTRDPVDGTPLPADPIEATVALLEAGRVLAVKGLGGYHLAADAFDETAVASLRARKHREDKPFAVMARDLSVARTLCELGDADEALLTSPERPIVLAPRRADAGVADAVAPRNRDLGVMLPYTPLHHLVARSLPNPFVLTSGNVSDEPIAFRDEDARTRLAGIADAFVTHDRPIHTRTDDSVVRSLRGEELVLRRSRGYVPRPLRLARELPRPVLACGAELKHTFCVAKGAQAFVSHHIGDLENYETYRAFTDGVDHFTRLFEVAPEVAVHDLHPDYLSTKYATGLEGVDLVGVQHHHGHIAACLADNAEEGPVIGVAFDGLGYGDDGTIWGGEVLVADLCGYTRAAHLDTVGMPGGANAIKEPWRMAAAHLDAAYDGEPPGGLAVAQRQGQRWDQILSVARAGANAPTTSSVGRLFDAISAICDVRDTVTYEGQAAIELEQLADRTEPGSYAVGLDDSPALTLRGGDLVRAVVDDHRAGVDTGAISARFHRGLAAAVGDVCHAVRERTGLSTVALSGGVFQNLLLLGLTLDTLRDAGFTVLTHRRVPPNDGGISLGQVAVAGARDRAAGYE